MILNYYKFRLYPQSVLISAKIKASFNRGDLLSDDNQTTIIQKNENDLFLILTYNSANPDVKSTLQRYLPIINSYKNLEILHHKNVVLGHRRNRNLRDILIKSRIRYPPTRRLNQISGREANVCVYTSNIRCEYCQKIDSPGKMYVLIQRVHTYNGPKDGTCGNNNLVYMVTCQRCQKQYVGENQRTLKDRFYRHFYD